MKAANPWITYRTRFLVNATKLTASLTFTDVFGRQHEGSRGDYLVESSDGVFSIASRQIFEDVYVPFLPQSATARKQTVFPHETTAPSLPVHLIRKSPQPCPERRSSSLSRRSV